MTPTPAEKKAKELIEKFENPIGESDLHLPEFITGIPCADGNEKYGELLDAETRQVAISCAIICVNEILEVLIEISETDSDLIFIQDKKQFWTEVKPHLEK